MVETIVGGVILTGILLGWWYASNAAAVNERERIRKRLQSAGLPPDYASELVNDEMFGQPRQIRIRQ